MLPVISPCSLRTLEGAKPRSPPRPSAAASVGTEIGFNKDIHLENSSLLYYLIKNNNIVGDYRIILTDKTLGLFCTLYGLTCYPKIGCCQQVEYYYPPSDFPELAPKAERAAASEYS